jgi:predicted component of type VI protein secretion system
VAGTWINYQDIPPSSPHVLKDGDIINIGEAAFRYQVRNGPNPPEENKENEL